MALLVDTSIFITLERQNRSWRDFFADEIRRELPAIASITASELLAGIYRGDTPERRANRESHVEQILDTLTVLPFDLDCARVHARLWQGLASSGLPIGRHDMLIAATAIASSSILLTDNVREFNRVPGLEVRRPGW